VSFCFLKRTGCKTSIVFQLLKHRGGVVKQAKQSEEGIGFPGLTVNPATKQQCLNEHCFRSGIVCFAIKNLLCLIWSKKINYPT